MKKILLIIPGLLFIHLANAQIEQDPVHWHFSAKKITDKTFEIHFTATIDPPWHIYAQDNNTDLTLPTSIDFNKNPLIEIEGKIKESGEIEKDKLDDTEIKYYENNVDFIQVVKLKGNVKTNISGIIHYMACTSRCLPPADRRFNIAVGDSR